MWKIVCPCCGGTFETDCTVEEIKTFVGATADCPGCESLLRIEADLTCSDFGEELTKRYSEAGLTISKEEACKSFIDF